MSGIYPQTYLRVPMLTMLYSETNSNWKRNRGCVFRIPSKMFLDVRLALLRLQGKTTLKLKGDLFKTLREIMYLEFVICLSLNEVIRVPATFYVGAYERHRRDVNVFLLHNTYCSIGSLGYKDSFIP